MSGSFHVKTEAGPTGRIGVMPFRESVSSVDVANMFGMELGYPTFDKVKILGGPVEKDLNSFTRAGPSGSELDLRGGPGALRRS